VYIFPNGDTELRLWGLVLSGLKEKSQTGRRHLSLETRDAREQLATILLLPEPAPVGTLRRKRLRA
jgi:hypothetical protein